jgi:hypothetical protein
VTLGPGARHLWELSRWSNYYLSQKNWRVESKNQGTWGTRHTSGRNVKEKWTRALMSEWWAQKTKCQPIKPTGWMQERIAGSEGRSGRTPLMYMAHPCQISNPWTKYHPQACPEWVWPHLFSICSCIKCGIVAYLSIFSWGNKKKQMRYRNAVQADKLNKFIQRIGSHSFLPTCLLNFRGAFVGKHPLSHLSSGDNISSDLQHFNCVTQVYC